MEEPRKDRTALIALLAGSIALLLGLCLGALGGSVAGYLIGRQAAVSQAPTVLTSPTPELVPTPPLSIVPELPILPRNLMGLSGALVREVVPNSPADRAGLQVGDIITGINTTPVDADHPLVMVLGDFKPGQRVSLKIWRAGQTRTISLTLGEHPEDKTRAYIGIRYVDVSMGRQRQGD
ncbi:MAG: S1C family serine protease [Anaerolineae bacterium]